jgi:hypothetical protein
MPTVRVNAEVQSGIQPDTPGLILPEGYWSDSRNVRYRDGAVEKVRGYERVLGSLSCTAIYASMVSKGTDIYWVYAGNNVAYATDGTVHAEITNLSGTFAASDDLGYTGGEFHGFLVLTDGVTVPQSWAPALANNFVSLTAWPADTTCRVLRTFKDFLFAFRITTQGDFNPREIRWSDIAGTGALPGSWDYTDPTNSSGRTELGQTGDAVLDGLPLRDSLIVYKEFNTWAADLVGGPDVFAFRQVFTQGGMLTEHCAANIGAQHLVVTDSDIVLHDGNDGRSLVDRRLRRWFFNKLNAGSYKRTFVVTNYRNREVFVCFPESGQAWPNLALVWNWSTDSWDVRELGRNMSTAAAGLIPGESVLIDFDTRLYDDAPEPFDDDVYNPASRALLFVDASIQAAYQNDAGETWDGVTMGCWVQRTGMALSNADLLRKQRIKRIMPRVLGTPGDVLNFYVGVRDFIDAPVAFRGPYQFRIAQDYKLDMRVTGRFLDLRVEYAGTNTFRLFGFDIEFDWDGLR